MEGCVGRYVTLPISGFGCPIRAHGTLSGYGYCGEDVIIMKDIENESGSKYYPTHDNIVREMESHTSHTHPQSFLRQGFSRKNSSFRTRRMSSISSFVSAFASHVDIAIPNFVCQIRGIRTKQTAPTERRRMERMRVGPLNSAVHNTCSSCFSYHYCRWITYPRQRTLPSRVIAYSITLTDTPSQFLKKTLVDALPSRCRLNVSPRSDVE
jgi:hypothetical protein